MKTDGRDEYDNVSSLLYKLHLIAFWFDGGFADLSI